MSSLSRLAVAQTGARHAVTVAIQAVSAALRQGAGAGNFEADLEYLRALQETLERTHGEQH